MTTKQAKRELYFWVRDKGTNFHSLLYTLITKADIQNRARLRLAFPDQVEVWEAWQAAPDEKIFFEEVFHE